MIITNHYHIALLRMNFQSFKIKGMFHVKHSYDRQVNKTLVYHRNALHKDVLKAMERRENHGKISILRL